MTSNDLLRAFARLSTPLISDACLRLDVAHAAAPPGIRPLHPELKIAGRALPVRHYGSVDIFLEARDRNSSYTFRKYLKRIGGAVEE